LVGDRGLFEWPLLFSGMVVSHPSWPLVAVFEGAVCFGFVPCAADVAEICDVIDLGWRRFGACSSAAARRLWFIASAAASANM